MSYKAEVIADSSGEWVANALRFPTREMAEKYGADLSMRWTAVREWRVVESEDPVMYYEDGVQIGPKGPGLGGSSRQRLERGPGSSYIVYGREYPPEGELVQTDWDFPALAQSLGWSLLRVQRGSKGKVVHLKKVASGSSKARCRHSGTDGTVDCRECGLTASDFISAAAEWLDERAN
jgi:hypothetical protein